MSSLLIIGGSGFFGKSILDAYHRQILKPWGINKVIILSRNASRLKIEQPRLISESVELINLDISTCSELPHADFVIHAAASTDAKNYLFRPEIEKKNIQQGTTNYCKLAKFFHPQSQIVFCSSGAIYGQQLQNIKSLAEEFKAGLIENLSPEKKDYAAAKLEAESAIKDLGGNGCKVSIARCFAFVGPYLARDQHFAIGNFIEDGLNKRPIVVKAEHMVYRSYMYADDLVIWLMTIAASANAQCPVFNVGSNQAIELHDLAKKIADFFNVPLTSAPISNLYYIDRYVPDVMKAETELNLKLKINLDQALRLTVDRIRNSR